MKAFITLRIDLDRTLKQRNQWKNIYFHQIRVEFVTITKVMF